MIGGFPSQLRNHINFLPGKCFLMLPYTMLVGSHFQLECRVEPEHTTQSQICNHPTWELLNLMCCIYLTISLYLLYYQNTRFRIWTFWSCMTKLPTSPFCVKYCKVIVTVCWLTALVNSCPSCLNCHIPASCAVGILNFRSNSLHIVTFNNSKMPHISFHHDSRPIQYILIEYMHIFWIPVWFQMAIVNSKIKFWPDHSLW